MPPSVTQRADEPTKEELEIAQAHTSHPGDPVSLGQPDGRKRRVDHPPTDIDTSYRTESYLLTWNGARHHLSPGQTGAGPDEALWLLTAWNAGARRCSSRENALAQRQLRDHLGERVTGVAVA